MLIQAALAAGRQVFSPALRGILWKSLGLTAGLLILIWLGLTHLFGLYLHDHASSTAYPVLDGFAFFLAGAGLFVALIYLLPVVLALVAGLFLDDVAEAVERMDYPSQAPGRPLSFRLSLVYGLRFAGLSLLVNLVALALFFIPVVNIGAFFLANAYLLGREYFELAAGRFKPMPDAARMRRNNRGTIVAAGAILAALALVPLFNLLTPLFGVALMVHLHKQLDARQALWEAKTDLAS